MNKIRFAANEDTNYVFHMLSVAGCGYHNEYGERHRPLYPQEDLAVLKENEALLTVSGGAHLGALYGALVIEPARGKVPAGEYYAGLLQAVPKGLEEYADVIRRIAGVMARHYAHYLENIWDVEREKLTAYIPQVRRLFEEVDFTDRAEGLVGTEFAGCFTATLVTSTENGAEAIDISDEQDIFGIERTPLDAFYFIGHEFIIYLLMTALKGTGAFQSPATWNLTEGLAEFYMKQVMGELRFPNHRAWVEFYEHCCGPDRLSPAELYQKACKEFL